MDKRPDLPADFSGRVEKQCGARGPSISEDFPNVKKRLSSMCQAHSQPEFLYPPVSVNYYQPGRPISLCRRRGFHARKHRELEGRYSKAHNRKTERFARRQASETGNAAPNRRSDPACGRATKTMPHPGNPLAIRNPLRFGQIERLCK